MAPGGRPGPPRDPGSGHRGLPTMTSTSDLVQNDGFDGFGRSEGGVHGFMDPFTEVVRK